MSQENVERAHRLYDTVSQRDRDALLDLLDEDVEVVPVLSSLEGRRYHGHDGVRQWWEDVFSIIPDYKLDVERISDFGDVTLAAFTARGHGLGSRTPVDQKIWHIIEWRLDKALRLVSFRSEAEALEAVGLREEDLKPTE